MTATLPSRALIGARPARYVPAHATDITVTWAKARRLQSLQTYRRSQWADGADEAAACRQMDADMADAGYVPAPCLPVDFDNMPF